MGGGTVCDTADRLHSAASRGRQAGVGPIQRVGPRQTHSAGPLGGGGADRNHHLRLRCVLFVMKRRSCASSFLRCEVRPIKAKRAQRLLPRVLNTRKEAVDEKRMEM